MSPLAARAGKRSRLALNSDIFCGSGDQLVADVGELSLHLGEPEPEQGAAGGEHKIEPGGHEGLMAAVDFTEAALGAVAVDGVADRGAGGHHADPGRGGRGPGGTHPPGQQESPAVNAAALLTNGAEIVVAPQALPGAESHLRQP